MRSGVMLSMVLILGSAGLTGCGGSSNSGTRKSSSSPTADQAQVIALGTRYDNAIGARDAAAACALMTPGLRREFVNRVGNGADCEQAIAYIFSTVTSYGAGQALEVAKKIKITNVQIQGHTAAVKLSLRFRGKTTHSHAQFQRTQQGWRISCCVGNATPG